MRSSPSSASPARRRSSRRRNPTRASVPPRSCSRRCRKASATTRPWSSRIKALKVRDFSPFEAISLWVKNPGPDDAELSLSVWDKDGNRSFPIPSTVTIKPGRWEQVVARLVLHGLDAKQIGSVHFYQKANRRPVTLLIADVQLLSPYAGRLAGQIQATRQALNIARNNALALGAKEQVEPKIAALARGLDQLENTAAAVNTASHRTERLLELARISTEAQELANSIQIGKGGRRTRPERPCSSRPAG